MRTTQDLLGYKWPWTDAKQDQETYLVFWLVGTLILIALATKYGSFAVGVAITAFIGVVVATRH